MPWVPVYARIGYGRVATNSGRPDARPQSDTHDPVLDFVQFRITGRQAPEPPFENTTGPSCNGAIPAVAAGPGSVCTFPFKTEIRLSAVGRPSPKGVPRPPPMEPRPRAFRKFKELHP